MPAQLPTLLDLPQAILLAHQHTPATKVSNVDLLQASQLTLAKDIKAKFSKPLTNTSAMDGFAINSSEVNLSSYQLLDHIPAGDHHWARDMKAGECLQVGTGSALSASIKKIIPKEYVTIDDGKVTINRTVPNSSFVRSAGLDFIENEIIVKEHSQLSSETLSLLAAAGHDTVPVYQPFSCALITNGDELVPVGTVPLPHQTVNSIPIGLQSMIQSSNGKLTHLGAAVDDPKSLALLLAKANQYDLLIIVGGASVGERDYSRSALQSVGGELIFSGINLKPGKPTWLGKIDQTICLGLPGNPASALVTAQLFLPAIQAAFFNKKLQYATDDQATGDQTTRKQLPGLTHLSANLAHDLPANSSRNHLLRAQLDFNADHPSVTANPKTDSSTLSPFASSNALIYRRAHDPSLSIGESVTVIYPLIK